MISPGRRIEDANPWAKAAVFAERYKILWIAGIAVAMWIGTRIIQPLNQITQVANAQATNAAQIDTVKSQLSVHDGVHKDLAAAITMLTRISCAKNLTPDEQYAFGVDCAKLPRKVP